jgi:LPXTG-motif cell wall-anchored protein
VPSFTTLFRRLLFVLLGAAFGLTLTATAASASPSTKAGNPNAACDGTHHSDTGHGANQSGAYDETCDGSPSGNGNGKGAAKGKPCAGCVGNADDKNPKGQAPNGSDHNAGYECDRNHGVGRTNPAHTGCTAAATDSTSTSGGKVNKPKPSNTPAPPAPVGCPAGTMPTGDGGCVASEVIVKPVLDPGPPATTNVDVKPSALGITPVTEVLGVSFVRALSSEVGVLGSELGRSSEGELPLTGVNSTPDLTAMALALVLAGTLFRRLGHRRPTGSEA